jgi:hypothetical protein
MGMSANLTEARRRLRRLGLFCIGLSPIVGTSFALMFSVWFGVLCGVICLSLGVYWGFAYLPFAGWLRRREQSH